MSTYGYKVRACKITNDTLHSANAHMPNERNQPPVAEISTTVIYIQSEQRHIDAQSLTQQCIVITGYRPIG